MVDSAGARARQCTFLRYSVISLKTILPKNVFMRTLRQPVRSSRAVRCLWQEPDAAKDYSTAVSLHSHTLHSREGFDFIPRVLQQVPLGKIVLSKLDEQCRRKSGKPVPFGRAFWRPPLHPHAAYDLEARQIHNILALRPLVSITDHDTVEACAELRTIGIDVPYSVEWTVAYHATVFHIGVHNLPPEEALALQAAMAAVTAAPEPACVRELLSALDRMPDVLLVLNHPFCCEEKVDRATHERFLLRFLREYGAWIHAFELNGLQPAGNNASTMRLAAEWDVPVISGGDRHCSEPNANLNLTNARTFTEFVQEIRTERRSSVLFMSQYRDPIPARYIEFIWQAVRDYPDFTGRERWVDRIFYQLDSGETIPCRLLWPESGPAVIRRFISVIGFLASPGMRAMLCRAMGRVRELEPEVP
jgi:hypothetical protein